MTILTRWPYDQITIFTRRPFRQNDQMTRWPYWQDDQTTRWTDDKLIRWPYWPDDQITNGPYWADDQGFKKRHQSPPKLSQIPDTMMIYDDLTILIYKNIIKNNSKPLPPKASPFTSTKCHHCNPRSLKGIRIEPTLVEDKKGPNLCLSQRSAQKIFPVLSLLEPCSIICLSIASSPSPGLAHQNFEHTKLWIC